MGLTMVYKNIMLGFAAMGAVLLSSSLSIADSENKNSKITEDKAENKITITVNEFLINCANALLVNEEKTAPSRLLLNQDFIKYSFACKWIVYDMVFGDRPSIEPKSFSRVNVMIDSSMVNYTWENIKAASNSSDILDAEFEISKVQIELARSSKNYVKRALNLRKNKEYKYCFNTCLKSYISASKDHCAAKCLDQE
jgi:hypothetical protein